jgi:hypothetical protein
MKDGPGHTGAHRKLIAVKDGGTRPGSGTAGKNRCISNAAFDVK